VHASDVRDAVEGALWGLLIGDALAAPLHWVYTWPAAQQLKRDVYGGGIRAYTGVPPAAADSHPDAAKYFSRCNPATEPLPRIFLGDSASDGPGGSRADAWRRPGRHYHATLPAGDNTLTGRLVALAAAGVLRDGGFDADAYFARYMRLLAGPGGEALAQDLVARGGTTRATDSASAAAAAAVAAAAAAAAATAGAVISSDGDNPRGLTTHNEDTWVDEGHRVLQRNMARAGAFPWEAGLDDCCLTGIALCVPILLAYAGDRDAQETGARALLQLTHKSEDMARQVGVFGDVMAALLGNAAAAAATAAAQGTPPRAPAPTPPRDVRALLRGACASYTDGALDLEGVLATFAGGPPDPTAPAGDPSAHDAPAFHGPRAVFSVR
jgi:hypothetical protein